MKKAELTSISISSAATTVKVGADLQLMAVLKYPPPRGPIAKAPIAWSSSDATIATVTREGVVTGRKVGVATIAAALSGKSSSITVTVTADRVLTSLALEPTSPKVGIGMTVAMIARGLYSDGTNAAVNDLATWTSSAPAIARISNSGAGLVGGLLVGVTAGTATITATVGGLTATTVATVSGATLKSLAVNPATWTIARQVNFDFKAIATLTDNSTMDVTASAMWSSSAPTIATVAGGRATGVAAGQANIVATYMNMTAMARLTVTSLTAVQLTVTPATATLPLDTTEKLTATAKYTDNTTQDVSTASTWTSSNEAVAKVDGNGIVTSVAPGTATITAMFGTLTATSAITVTNATLTSISVTPATQTLVAGLMQQYMATAVYSDNSQRVVTNDVSWATLNSAVAGISNGVGTKGMLTAVGAGQTMVTASLSQKVGSATVTVTTATLSALAISPSNQRVPVNGLVTYEARALFTDGVNRDVTTEVTWASSNAAVASISNAAGTRGHASALTIGTTMISATFGALTASTTLTVSNATLTSITVLPVTRTIAKGTSSQLRATGIYSDNTNSDLTELADWTSSVSATATVSGTAGTRGLVTGVLAGTAVITATFDGQSASATVTVTNATLVSIAISPTNQTVARGSLVDFEASGVFSDSTTQDLTNQVIWSSSVTASATISNVGPTWGRASTVAAGATVITATFGTISGTTNLTVTNATLTALVVSPSTSTVPATFMVPLTATGTFSDSTTQDLTEEVFWSSSNTALATVSIALGHEGEVTGVAPGMATITASFQGRTGTATVTVTNATLNSIAVTPPSATVSLGNTQQYLATGTFSDASTLAITTQVTWTTSNNAVAVASNLNGSQGAVVGVAVGTVTVTAARGATTGTATLIVNNSALVSISVTATPSSIAKGTTSQLTATGLYADNSNQDITDVVTWSSATLTVATVSNSVGTRGQATGVNNGTSVITAALGGKTGMATLTVTTATLSTVAITPPNPSIAKGTTQQFTVTGTYSDTSTQDLTATASWTSSNTAVATISNTSPTIGLATSLTAGSTTITVTVGGKTAMTTLTVTAATLSSLAITLTNPSIAKGLTLSFGVIGTYTDATTQVLTTSATWASSNTAVASISNATGTEGVASALTVGTSNITATVGAITAPAQIMTVTGATLVSIAVTPPTPSIADGTTQQFTATGTFTDTSTVNLTTSVTWTTIAGTGTASISNTAGTEGLATATDPGTVTVRATSGSIFGSAALTVTTAVLARIDVTPLTTTNSPLGLPVPYVATGVYTDMTTQVMTTTVTWSSSDMAVATISNGAGTEGRATTAMIGTTTITATNGTLTSAPATLNVGAATVASIAIGGLSQIANLTQSQLTATATYTDGQTQDVTTVATWGSTMTGVATISNTVGTEGIVEGVSAGMTTISAAFGGQTGTRVFTVSNATIVSMGITPATPTLADGSTRQFTPTATFSDMTTQNMILQATWASSNGAVASISNATGSKGLATGLDTGMTTISAVWNSISGSTVMTVTAAVLQSISVTPAGQTIVVGTTRRFTATGIYDDNTTRDITQSVTWSVVGAGATIDNTAGFDKGTATGTAAGMPAITATLGLISGSTALTVTAATFASISLSPVGPSIAAGTTQQFTATGNIMGGGTQDVTDQATWAISGVPGVASISNVDGTRGLLTGLTPGMRSVSAIVNGQLAANSPTVTVTAATLASIAVIPASPSVPKGVNPQFTAVGTYTDGSMQDLTTLATWASVTMATATISNGGGTQGLATTVAVGTTSITATYMGRMGDTTLTVTPATLNSITVTPANGNLAIAANQAYVATANYTDGPQVITLQATWSSTNPAVATVSNAMGSIGRVTGVANGTTTIRATFEGTSGSTGLTVP